MEGFFLEIIIFVTLILFAISIIWNAIIKNDVSKYARYTCNFILLVIFTIKLVAELFTQEATLASGIVALLLSISLAGSYVNDKI